MSVRIRLLPIFIVVASMMLMTKISTVWFRISEPDASAGLFQLADASDSGLLVVSQEGSREQLVISPSAVAQIDDNLEPDPGEPAIIRPSVADPKNLTPIELTEGEALDVSVGNLSPAEIRLLHNLANRRKRIIDLEKELIERESLLRAAEQQLENKQERLNEIRAEINNLITRYDKQKEEENARLRLIYSNMKPKAAAAIFNELDVETLIGVLQDMSPRVVAPMIAAMDVQKARQLTRELAERRAIDRLALE